MNHVENVKANQQVLVKLMAIADRLDARNLQTAQQLEAATAALEQGAHRLNDGCEQFAQRALQVIGTGAQQAFAQGAEQAVAQYASSCSAVRTARMAQRRRWSGKANC